MLQPKRTKYRRQMKRAAHTKGTETRGVDLHFGDYALRALEPEWVTDRHIEAGRVAISRKARRGALIYIRIFPDKPLTSKPAEVRMGKGKGAPEKWVAEVKAGRILYEISGVSGDVAKEALRLAMSKMPMRCEIVSRSKCLL
ncbi:MAG: 50S ribosomal protein L16 [Bdellovibrionota bacterium]|jgi:large subunit ribosomal protein L16